MTFQGQWNRFILYSLLPDIPQSTIVTVTPTPILVKATSSLTNEGIAFGHVSYFTTKVWINEMKYIWKRVSIGVLIINSGSTPICR